MTATTFRQDFSDFCAQRDAQNTIQLNVTKWTFMLCDALRQNYIDYSIKSHSNSIFHLKGTSDSAVKYHLACIQDLKNGHCGGVDFIFESGNKYHKVIYIDSSGSRSVHCFIDKKTGEVYKSASWKSPAKGVRFDLRIIEQREWLFQHADWAGGYLYKR